MVNGHCLLVGVLTFDLTDVPPSEQRRGRECDHFIASRHHGLVIFIILVFCKGSRPFVEKIRWLGITKMKLPVERSLGGGENQNLQLERMLRADSVFTARDFPSFR